MSIYSLFPRKRGSSPALDNRRGLRIGHINAQSLRAAGGKRDTLEANYIKAQNNFDIFGITETWFIDDNTTDNDTTDNDRWIIDGYHEPEVECRTVSVGSGGVAMSGRTLNINR